MLTGHSHASTSQTRNLQDSWGTEYTKESCLCSGEQKRPSAVQVLPTKVKPERIRLFPNNLTISQNEVKNIGHKTIQRPAE